MIKILADKNLYKLHQFLPKEIDYTLYNPQAGIPGLEGFDAWLIRTVTKVNPITFPDLGKSLKFVGTGSSGSDHVDITYLNSKDVQFVSALGCNARAVAEYVMTAILLWKEKRQKNLSELTFGIIGVGKAGSEVANLFSAFGLKTVLYDPPREKRETDFISSTVEEVLNCDVLTFHVPLENKDTPYSTYHWLNEEKLTGQRFELIINTARGGVIEEQAVLKAMDRGYVHDIVIDVWENEPDFDPTFMKRAFIATPHIAGYSEQAKLSASRMICDQLCDFFQLPKPTSETIFPEKKLFLTKQHYSLKEVLLQLHPVKEYHTLLLKLSTHKNKIELFKKLRTDHPFRFEYPSLRLEAAYFDDFSELVKLGIQSQ